VFFNSLLDAGSHFKSGKGGQPGYDLQMPVIVIILLILNRGGMKYAHCPDKMGSLLYGQASRQQMYSL
jgi:hypothetical protein